MKRLRLAPDVVVTSPLVRARRTAEIVAGELRCERKLVVDERLAHGLSVGRLGKIIAAHGGAGSIMLVGHEPEFSAVIGELIGGGRVVCRKGGLARVDLPDPSSRCGELVWLLQPAQLAGE